MLSALLLHVTLHVTEYDCDGVFVTQSCHVTDAPAAHVSIVASR